jgi:hypothetical protein
MKETTFKPRLEVLESRIMPTTNIVGYVEIVVGTGMIAFAGYQLTIAKPPVISPKEAIVIGLAGFAIATKGGVDVSANGINNNVIPNLFKNLGSQLDHSVPALAPFFDSTIQSANQLTDTTLQFLGPLLGTPAQAAQANTNTGAFFDPDNDDDDDSGMAGY